MRCEPLTLREVVLIDNYDSFTYNLVQALGCAGARCAVVAHDAIDVATLRARAPVGIVLGPGPCTPQHAGVTLSVLRELSAEVPILGVCLGHQALAEAFGGAIERAPELVHGEASRIYHDGEGVFSGLPNPFLAGRYNSLVVARASLPPSLKVSAWTTQGGIMGLRHVTRPAEGVQFHPESVLTEVGVTLLRNWVGMLTMPCVAG